MTGRHQTVVRCAGHLPQRLDDIERGESIIITRHGRALERLKDDEAFAPSLLWFELRNLLLANERRQRITAAQTAAALNLVQEGRQRHDAATGARAQADNL